MTFFSSQFTVDPDSYRGQKTLKVEARPVWLLVAACLVAKDRRQQNSKVIISSYQFPQGV